MHIYTHTYIPKHNLPSLCTHVLWAERVVLDNQLVCSSCVSVYGSVHMSTCLPWELDLKASVTPLT